MLRHFFWILIFLAVVSSCEKSHQLRFGKKGSQVIHINFIYSPFTIDPRKGTDPVTTVTNYMLYEGLTRLEPDGTVSPALAERVKISKDRKKYIFFLRKSMWSDGSPVTAYHFEAAWKKALSPEFSSRAAHLLFPINNAEEAKMGKCSLDEVGVEAIDELTLLVRLKRPTPYFLELTAYPTYFPVPHNGDEVLHPNQQNDLLTNGPFSLASWRDDDEIVTVKNPYYWNADEVKLDEVHATIITDEATALKLFDQGDLDYVGGLVSPLPLDAIATLKKTHRLRQRPIAGTTFSTFNVNKFPFNNLHIRKAFAYAVDKEEIIDNISQMFDDMATGPVPHVLKNTAISLYKEYNREAAVHHFEMGLQELGITREEFPTVTYSYFSSELQRNLALALQSQWKETLGIVVELDGKELKSHLAKLHNHKFQIGQMAWIGQYHDRMCFLERFASKNGYCNYSGWENFHYQRLIEDSFYKGNGDRALLLEEAEQMIKDEMPIIPLYHFHAVYVKNPRLHGLAISPMGDIQFHRAYLQ
ncbi:MAG: peptide ABC transporter substrate-binding protein [Simkaniaceae bacterium]|nr:MAG: peptide ABC transporter substrate-binding protein [Simkaniaceae bacterium]